MQQQQHNSRQENEVHPIVVIQSLVVFMPYDEIREYLDSLSFSG